MWRMCQWFLSAYIFIHGIFVYCLFVHVHFCIPLWYCDLPVFFHIWNSLNGRELRELWYEPWDFCFTWCTALFYRSLKNDSISYDVFGHLRSTQIYFLRVTFLASEITISSHLFEYLGFMCLWVLTWMFMLTANVHEYCLSNMLFQSCMWLCYQLLFCTAMQLELWRRVHTFVLS